MSVDVDHLGVVIGDPTRARVVALETSAVFRDAALLRKFWNMDASELDSGVQAHLYTRSEDVFVVGVPRGVGDPAHRLAVALDVNCRIWRRFARTDLTSSTSRVVLASGRHVALPDEERRPATMTLSAGSMLDAVASRWRDEGDAVLAFVLGETLLGRLGIDASADADLARRARTVSELMDKGAAMAHLQRSGVPCAWSHTFESDDEVELLESVLTPGERYVFKPAGGAASIGVFTDGEKGASPRALVRHVRRLRAEGRLPRRFLVQEFLSGPVTGASLLLDGCGGCRVLEIHQQQLDDAFRFVGARWTRSDHEELEGGMIAVGRDLSKVLEVPLLVGVDMVDGRVIELNPRLTASAPIAHLLRMHDHLAEALAGRPVERIDIAARMPISAAAIATGRVEDAVELVHARYGALVLPQGLNPFGSSRVTVVNDDRTHSARLLFERLVR